LELNPTSNKSTAQLSHNCRSTSAPLGKASFIHTYTRTSRPQQDSNSSTTTISSKQYTKIKSISKVQKYREQHIEVVEIRKIIGRVWCCCKRLASSFMLLLPFAFFFGEDY